MALRLTLTERDGATHGGRLETGRQLLFGRSGGEGVVGLGSSRTISRLSFRVDAHSDTSTLVEAHQSSGSVEVRRPDGVVAAVLHAGESGSFAGPIDILLHTREGVFATVQCRPESPAARQPGASRDFSSTLAGWSPMLVEDPDPGLDWFVAAGLAAALLRRGRLNDPAYVLGRGVLLRACGIWLGQPKSEGWLASKFKQAGQALSVTFEASPAQQLGEYVLRNKLLDEAQLDRLYAQYEQRRRR